jgi:hypothetical protein
MSPSEFGTIEIFLDELSITGCPVRVNGATNPAQGGSPT